MTTKNGVVADENPRIRHVLPHIGQVEACLYEPAANLYRHLRKIREVRRLQRLRHLGALSRALPGARQARWDYTVAMLYYISALNVTGMKSSFRLANGLEFTSAQAALQTVALCWNIGHLPGTFGVEKGVYRFLCEKNKGKPATILPWPTSKSQDIVQIRKQANSFLEAHDDAGLCRVLAVLKLLSDATLWNEERPLIRNFISPFLLCYENDNGHSKQWRKLRAAFDLIRHLAYLTLDMALAGLHWCPSIPLLLRQGAEETSSLDQLAANIAEILSPVERIVFRRLYYSPAARKETALVASRVYEHLKNSRNHSAEVSRWLRMGLFRNLGLERTTYRPRTAGTIRIRSHFVLGGDSVAAMESTLRRKGFHLPVALQYRAWNSESILEPDELLVDGIMAREPCPRDVGRLVVWLIDKFDNCKATPDSEFDLLRKADLEAAYVSLLQQAFQLAFKGVALSLEPWPLTHFGLFPMMPVPGARGAVWAGNARLDDPITKHIIRKRSVPSGLRAEYAELLGLRGLSLHLRRGATEVVPAVVEG